MKRSALASVALLLLILSSARGQDGGVMIQGFAWDSKAFDHRAWWEVLADKSPELRQMGVTGWWAPPATKGSGGGFSAGYDLYDYYDLGSKDQCGTIPTRWGTKTQFLEFVAIAHANGQDVYSDIVLNQRSGGAEHGFRYDSLKGAEAVGRGTMAPWDFHQSGFHDPWREAVAGLPDIAQELPAVRDKLFAWMRWFDKQTDVDGYRIDAAKHMDPAFLEGALYQVQERMGPNRKRFAFGEYYDGNPNTLQWWVNAVHRRASALDFQGFFTLRDLEVQGGYFDVRRLRTGRFWDETRSVTFVNSHDTFERGNGLQIFGNADLCYAVIMAFPGYPIVFWKDLYDDNLRPRDYLRNLIWVHNKFAKGPAIERWADQNLYVLEREGSLLFGLNVNSNTWRYEWVRTSFGPGVKLHDYTGRINDCWTNQDGWVQIAVPPRGYVMLARDGQQNQPATAPARRTTQEWEGNADMDRPRAGEWWSEPVDFVSDAGKPIQVEVYLQDKSLTPHVCLLDKDGKRLNHARGKNGAVKLEFANPPKAGFYRVRVGLEQTGKNTRSPYWVKVDYQAPAVRPTALPVAGSEDKNVLPLVPTSIGP